MQSRSLKLSRLQSALSLVHAGGWRPAHSLQQAPGSVSSQVNDEVKNTSITPSSRFHALSHVGKTLLDDRFGSRTLSSDWSDDLFVKEKDVTGKTGSPDNSDHPRIKQDNPVFFLGKKRNLSAESRVLFVKGKKLSSGRDAEHLFGLRAPQEIKSQTRTIELSSVLPKCTSVKQLFDILQPRLNRDEVQLSEIPKIYDRLVQLVFRKELANIPWISSDYPSLDRVRKQVVLSGRFEELVGPTTSHPVYQKLRETSTNASKHFTLKDLIHTASGIACLHLTEVCPIFTEMCNRLLNPDEEGTDLDVFDLEKINVCLEKVNKTLIDCQVIGSRLTKILQNDASMPKNSQTVLSVLWLGISSTSDRVAVLCCAWTCSALKDIAYLSDNMNVIATCFRLASRLSEVAEENCSEELLNIALTSAMEHAVTLTPSDIAVIARFSENMNIYSLPWADRIKGRSLELLFADSGNVVDKAHALTGILDTNLPAEVQSQIEDIILKKLDDVDALTLSSICRSLRKVSWRVDKTLLSTCESLLLEDFDTIMKFSLLRREALLFLETVVVSEEVDAMLNSQLYRMLHTSEMGVVLSLYCPVIRYLLPWFKNGLPARDYKQLLSSIPQCDKVKLIHIAVGLRNINKPMSSQLRAQVSEIYKTLNETVKLKKETFNSIEDIVSSIHFFYLYSSCKDIEILKGLLKKLPCLTKTLDSAEFVSTCFLLYRLNYNYPEVNDNLIDHVVKERQGIQNLLTLLGEIGYPPEKESQRQALCQILEEQFDEMDILRQLQCLKDCCILEMFPEKIIQKVFSVDYLSKVDALLAETEDIELKQEAQELMMMVNRSVTLERPDLGIPWFHEHYKSRQLMEVGEPEMMYLQGTIKQALIAVLGGDKFIGENVRSPYLHNVMFECLLNYKNQPVPYTMNNVSYAKKMELLRVAIQPCTMNLNTQKLQGLMQMEKRQLELIGYKLILVSKYEWDQRSNTWEENKQFLKRLIFGQ